MAASYKVSTPRAKSQVSQDGAGNRIESADGSRWAISRNQKCRGPNKTFTVVECWTLKQRNAIGKIETVATQCGEDYALEFIGV